MFGVKAGNAVFENTTHREERSKDHDSISRVCGSHSRCQGLLRIREGGGADLTSATGHHLQRVPLGLQPCGLLGTRGRQVGEIPAIHQGGHARQHGAQVFVGHGTQHRMGTRVKAHRIEVGRQGGH